MSHLCHQREAEAKEYVTTEKKPSPLTGESKGRVRREQAPSVVPRVSAENKLLHILFIKILHIS